MCPFQMDLMILIVMC